MCVRACMCVRVFVPRPIYSILDKLYAIFGFISAMIFVLPACCCSAGDTCSEDVDDCTPTHECRNGATCIDVLNGYTCDCRPGWRGRLCSQEVNECMSQPCANGGICTDALNGYTCECTSNFGGATCTEDVNECLTQQPCRNYVLCDNTFGGYNCLCLPGLYHISQTAIL